MRFYYLPIAHHFAAENLLLLAPKAYAFLLYKLSKCTNPLVFCTPYGTAQTQIPASKDNSLASMIEI